MTYRYKVTGSERKALVNAISEFLVLPAIYRGAPTFAYEIGSCVVDKNGTLSFAEDVTAEAATLLVATLKEHGYRAEENLKDVVSEDRHTLVIEMPRTGFSDDALERLKQIIASKETLIKKAIGAEHLPIEVAEDKLCFPWFVLSGIDDEADAYTRFIHTLCKMAKMQKRIMAKDRTTENDKLSMRLFLIRLGFVGSEYKAARKILLRNLTGNSAWKNGQPPACTGENTEEV